jgi:hypothetical protein
MTATVGVPTATPTNTGTPASGPPPSIAGLHVSGNQLLNAGNQPVVLHGVDRSGTEYACVQGWGIFDGPSDAASVQAIAAWHANAVRVPLNEDCWLGINGVNPAYAGANYQAAIVNYVTLLKSEWSCRDPGSALDRARQQPGHRPTADARPGPLPGLLAERGYHLQG